MGAEGHNSEVLLQPRAIFKDPFRGAPNILVLCDVWNAWDGKPTIGNTRAACADIMDKYKDHDPWFGIEQEYTLMYPTKVGELPLSLWVSTWMEVSQRLRVRIIVVLAQAAPSGALLQMITTRSAS